MVQSRNISTGQNIGGQESIYANKSFCLVFCLYRTSWAARSIGE